MQHRTSLAIVLFALPQIAFAHVVINEVNWAGSDLSTADEWIELFNPDDAEADLAGWSVTTMNSKGEHLMAIRFATGSTLGPAEYAVIARKSAADSRLALEPTYLAPDLVLPNTNLLLRLRDQAGLVVDEVDDGSGVPFAGPNPSGTGTKLSMERLEPSLLGTVKEHWKHAMLSAGIDDGARLVATPGYPNGASDVSGSSPTLCMDPLFVRIDLQSGSFSGVGKTTMNVQAVAVAGSLSSASCRWNFGDGSVSDSCNPPARTYDVPGTYPVLLEATNKCGVILHDQAVVTVASENASGVVQYDDGSRLRIKAALPNPEGSDPGHEWVEIRNMEEKGVSLTGWRLRVSTTVDRWIPLKGSIDARSFLRVYDSELRLSLPNTKAVLTLVAPSGQDRSSVEWVTADEGREYLSSDIRDVDLHGRLVRVLGSTIFQIELSSAAAEVVGENVTFVRLAGINPVTPVDEQDQEDRRAFLDVLLRGKELHLELASGLWDEQGSLLAYVYSDSQLSIQEQLLAHGLWSVDRSAPFPLQQRFIAQEKTGLVERSEKVSTETTDPQPVPIPMDASGLSIAEIFPAPHPQRSPLSHPLLAEEWIKMSVPEHGATVLSGITLRIGTRKKTLCEGMLVASGSMVLLLMRDLHLQLPNNGSTVSLLLSDGSIVDSVAYPKLKHGEAYIRREDGTFCIAEEPRPEGVSICDAAAQAVPRQTKPRASVSRRVQTYARAYGQELRDAGTQYVVESSPASSSSAFLVFLGGASLSLSAAAVLFWILARAGILQINRKMV